MSKTPTYEFTFGCQAESSGDGEREALAEIKHIVKAAEELSASMRLPLKIEPSRTQSENQMFSRFQYVFTFLWKGEGDAASYLRSLGAFKHFCDLYQLVKTHEESELADEEE